MPWRVGQAARALEMALAVEPPEPVCCHLQKGHSRVQRWMQHPKGVLDCKGSAAASPYAGSMGLRNNPSVGYLFVRDGAPSCVSLPAPGRGGAAWGAADFPLCFPTPLLEAERMTCFSDLCPCHAKQMHRSGWIHGRLVLAEPCGCCGRWQKMTLLICRV